MASSKWKLSSNQTINLRWINHQIRRREETDRTIELNYLGKAKKQWNQCRLNLAGSNLVRTWKQHRK